MEVVNGVFAFNERDEVLLVKGPKFVEWVIPGGHVEHGETLQRAVERELLEEVGVRAKPVFFGVGEALKKKINGKERHFVFLDYACRLKSPKLRLQASELNEALWIPWKKALKLKEVSQSVRSALPAAFKALKVKKNG
ncbi:hypothetical protein AUJ14_03140 [Candidatus Micrarchaeota archaeon CG1_02_55_22]|nr:MAG: hypothetical protein AUJ14_03140 [Candidatus Micrarchaeota archaeon CG1_02_55_22]